MARGRAYRLSLEDMSDRLISARILSFIWGSGFRVICAYLIFGVLGCFALQWLGQGMDAVIAEWRSNLLGNLGWGVLIFIGEHLIMLVMMCIELPAAVVSHLLFSEE